MRKNCLQSADLGRSAAAGFLLVGLCVASFAAPTTATVQGTVTDVSGAALTNAAVALRHRDQGRTTTTSTDSQGKYRVAGLLPGGYEMSVSSQGFKTAKLQIALSSGQTLTRDVKLDVGSTSETVEVTSGRAGPRRGIGSIFGSSKKTVASAPPPPPPLASVPLAARDEEYGSTKETGFASVRTKPLSTFSIDVDTASYSNLRRFILQQGQLPPKEAVRIEELLNFFDYEYPTPVGPHPFSVTAEIGNCPWNRAHQLVHIGLKSSPVATKDLPPSNLVFLIDVSGSMMPENKLPLIKKSFRLLVEQLRTQDKVSIVVYAGAAGLVLPPTSGSHKQVILDAIERLQAGGSTAGAQGIQLAYATARRNFNRSGNNRVILATDGDFNVGVSSDAELVKLIEAERQAGIFLTVLGYGYGNLKDAKLESLARNGNGNYAYIDTVLEARRVLVEQMGATLLTVAKDVKLQVEFNPARIKAYRLIGYENRRLNDEDFKDDTKDAGELGAGHSVTAVYEVVPADSPENVGLEVDPLKYQSNQVVASAAGSSEALTVKLRYKQPKGDSSIEFAQPVEHRVVAAPSRNFRLTMAVCELGLLLSDSSFKKDASFKSAIANAQSAIGDDASGMRSEFVYIANTAAKLASINARK